MLRGLDEAAGAEVLRFTSLDAVVLSADDSLARGASNPSSRENAFAGGWTILDGGVAAEASVTEKPEYDAFDDMDWG